MILAVAIVGLFVLPDPWRVVVLVVRGADRGRRGLFLDPLPAPLPGHDRGRGDDRRARGGDRGLSPGAGAAAGRDLERARRGGDRRRRTGAGRRGRRADPRVVEPDSPSNPTATLRPSAGVGSRRHGQTAGSLRLGRWRSPAPLAAMAALDRGRAGVRARGPLGGDEGAATSCKGCAGHDLLIGGAGRGRADRRQRARPAARADRGATASTCATASSSPPRGNDTIEARDGGNDEINCGDGNDVAIVDATEDGVYDCEVVREPAP